MAHVAIPGPIPLPPVFPSVIKTKEGYQLEHDAEGRGIIITQIPERAKSPSDKFVTCILFEGVKERLFAVATVPFNTPGSPPTYAILDVEGAGKGMFAAKAFARGDLIIRERPLLVMPAFIPPPALGDFTQDDVFAFVVRHMSDRDRERYFALHNCKSNDKRNIMEISNTNALPAGDQGMPGHFAQYITVCDEISRVNHSCCANATYRWNMESFTAELWASRPIAKGEQITLNYIGDLSESYRDRQSFLQRYKFTCTCTICSLPEAERRPSDVRRNLLGRALREGPDLDDGVDAWVTNPALPDDYILKRYLRFAEMMEQEMLGEPRPWMVIARPLVKAYCALQDGDAARTWASKAAGWTLAETGSDGGWKEVLAAPEKTEWWGRRVRVEHTASAL